MSSLCGGCNKNTESVYKGVMNRECPDCKHDKTYGDILQAQGDKE